MNKLLLKEATREYVVYFYIPEGKGEPGEIRMDMGNGEAYVVQRAEEDTAIGRYGHNASRKIKEYVKEGYLPIDAYQAWN